MACCCGDGLLLLALLLVLLLCSPVASGIDYFGFYDDDPPVTAAFTNFHIGDVVPPAEAAITVSTASPRSQVMPALLLVQQYFLGCGRVLCTDRSKWKEVLPVLRQLLANRTILGFNLGDELVWNTLKPAEMVKYADAVRADFPRGQAIIWYNEAAFFTQGSARSTWTDSARNNVSDYSIPSSLDWFSIDMYHMDGSVVGWVDQNVRHVYTTQIYPNLTATQSVMLVPGAFGSNVNHFPNGTVICDRECYDIMCAQDAQDFYEWGKADPRVVAIAPWNWGGCATCNGSRFTPPHTCCMDEIGTKDQPLTRAAWTKIGKAIKGSG